MTRSSFTVLWNLLEGTAGPGGPRWPPACPIWPTALWNSPWRWQPVNQWTRAAAAAAPLPRPRRHFPSGTLQASAPGRTKSIPTPWTPSGQNIWEWIYDAWLPCGHQDLSRSSLQPFLLFSFKETCRIFKYWQCQSCSPALPSKPCLLFLPSGSSSRVAQIFSCWLGNAA